MGEFTPFGSINTATIGARRDTDVDIHFKGKIAEVALWNVALSDDEIALLSQGESPLNIRRADLIHYWPLDGNASPEPDLVGARPGTLVGTLPLDSPRGYRLYLGAGFTPDPNVDAPLFSVGRDALSTDIDLGQFVLLPNTTYGGLVLPYNQVGPADTGSEFSFRTDGTGAVSMVPAPVTNLIAEPLAGGYVKVSWHYDEPNPLFALADSFAVSAVSEDVIQSPIIEPVPHIAHKRNYEVTFGPVPDALWKITVSSLRALKSEPNVQITHVRSDATPPADVSLGLEAA